MKCVVCRGPAVIDVRRHNANFCPDHFVKLCRDQVERAIADFDMMSPGDRVLVAVSGGKDSLAIWDILVGLGYEADGLYVGLGIGEYSDGRPDMPVASPPRPGCGSSRSIWRRATGTTSPPGRERPGGPPARPAG